MNCWKNVSYCNFQFKTWFAYVSHCFVQLSFVSFSLLFQVFPDICQLLYLHVPFFSLKSCKKQGNLEISCKLSTAECCWVLLRNQIPNLFPFFFHLFCWLFPLFSPNLMIVSAFFRYFLICQLLYLHGPFFSLKSCKKQENLEISCKLSTAECCWVLLSAAECCWVLLRNQISNLFPSFFHVFCWFFPLFSPNLMVFSQVFKYVLIFVRFCTFMDLSSA